MAADSNLARCRPCSHSSRSPRSGASPSSRSRTRSSSIRSSRSSPFASRSPRSCWPLRRPDGCGRSDGRAGSPARRSASCSPSATGSRRRGSSARPSRARASSPASTSSSRRCSRSLLFRTRVAGAVWVGVALAVVGLAMLSGVGAGDPVGDLLVLARLGGLLGADRADGAVRAALRPDRVHAGGDARGVRRLRGRRGRARTARGAARLDGLGCAPRHRDLRERARVPRPDVGAAADERDAAPRSPSRWSRSSPDSSASGSPATGWARSAGAAAR